MDQDGQNEKLPVPLDYDAGGGGEVAVRRKYTESLNEAKAFEQFGQKVMRIKLKTLAAIGKRADELGIKNIGHGKVLFSGEDAESAILKLDRMIEDFTARDVEPEVILGLMQLRLGYNKQIMESGKAHLDADKAARSGNTTPNITIPFPAGNPMVVAIKQSNGIEDSKPNN